MAPKGPADNRFDDKPFLNAVLIRAGGPNPEDPEEEANAARDLLGGGGPNPDEGPEENAAREGPNPEDPEESAARDLLVGFEVPLPYEEGHDLLRRQGRPF